MKLDYLAPSVIPSRTANSIHVMRMCRSFAASGHEVRLLVPQRKAEQEPAIHDVFAYYGVPPSFGLRYLPGLRLGKGEYLYGLIAALQAKTNRPDLVYSRDALGALMAVHLGLPTVYEAHRPFPAGAKGALLRRLATHPNLTRIVVISEALRNMLLADMPEVAAKIMVAHDGADVGRAQGVSPEEGLLHVGYVGHLYEGRGIDLILAMAAQCPWAIFHLAGGTEKDIAFRRQQPAVSANVRFHGFIPPSETAAWQAQCHVMLAPYQRQVYVPGGMDTSRFMSPLKIVEYMASGRAMLASDLPVLHEVLEEGRTALFCPPDSTQAWVAALTRLRDDPILRERLGRQAKQLCEARYSWDMRAKRVIEGVV